MEGGLSPTSLYKLNITMIRKVFEMAKRTVGFLIARA